VQENETGGFIPQSTDIFSFSANSAAYAVGGLCVALGNYHHYDEMDALLGGISILTIGAGWSN